MDDKASSLDPCLKTSGTHGSRHSKSMDTTSLHSFVYSDTLILIGTYSVFFKCLIRLTTHTPVL